MFRFKVLKMSDILKYLVVIIITILFVISSTRFFLNRKKTVKTILKPKDIICNFNFIQCVNKTIPAISEINDEYNKIESENNAEKQKSHNYLEFFLKSEISVAKEINNQINKKNEIVDSINNEEEKNVENNISTNNEKKQTEVLTVNPIAENVNFQNGNIKIKNQTSYTINDELLNSNLNIDNKNILIFHTHSCESYTSSEKFPYNPTGNFRTTDLNYTVTRVGTELEKYLKEYSFNVIHDTSYHDYPSYNGSYTRSLQTVENIIKDNPTDIIIDLHRDAIGSREDYAPLVKIGEDNCAQIMFVIGTNEGGLYHPNWTSNLKFAIQIQKKAEEMYPGLFKPIMLTKSRYNQHTGKYASIIEVGATGNTLEQCLNSMKYLSSVMNEVINN